MPPLPRLRIEALAELARQLRFEPREAARRQLVRAEELARQVFEEVRGLDVGANDRAADGGNRADTRAGRTYPQDWVIFRLTGYRTDEPASDGGGAPAVLVGEALLGDLAVLVERLSAAAGITLDELKPEAEASAQWLSVDELCARWRVGRKSLERYRRLGLVGRRALVRPSASAKARGGGRDRLLFNREVVERFETAMPAMLGNAAGFTRIERQLRERMIRRARRYHAKFGCTPNKAAARLARRFGRGQETVRAMLIRHDETSDAPIFHHRGVLGAEGRAKVERAAAHGESLTRVARRVGKSAPTVYRALHMQRAARLRELDLSAAGDGESDEALGEKLLSVPVVSSGLITHGPRTLGEWFTECSPAEPMSAKTEQALSSADQFLRRRAARTIAGLSRHSPSQSAIDRAETDLRWASRLKIILARSQMGLALRTIQGYAESIGLREAALPGLMAQGLARAAIDAVIEGVGRQEPVARATGVRAKPHASGSAAGRLAARVGIVVNRAVSQWLRPDGTGLAAVVAAAAGRGGVGGGGGASLAARRIDPASVPIEDWTRRVDPWQEWLELRGDVVALALSGAAGSEIGRRVVVMRWGLDGTPPRSAREVGVALKMIPTRVATLERKTIAQLTVSAGKADSRE